jgi:uncharacterized membrane protein
MENEMIKKEERIKAEPKDVFTHLLAIVALYFSAGSFMTLIFQYVNIALPDPLENGSSYLTGAYNLIRFAISSLIIIFPVYIFTTRFLNKSYEQNPLKRNLRIRKWLVYFTLFVTALVIIGDLVALINNLLGGELTVRFLLKVVTVFFVAASIFSYYFWELKKHKEE